MADPGRDEDSAYSDYASNYWAELLPTAITGRKRSDGGPQPRGKNTD
jgi:hypothetical protein